MDTRFDLGSLVLRVGIGLQIAVLHGWGKFQNLIGDPKGFSDPLGIGWKASLTGAVAGEFACGILLVIGLFTRLASLGMAFTMGVIVFVVHGADPWKRKEMALLYLTGALATFLSGPGRFSLDARLAPRLPRWMQRLL